MAVTLITPADYAEVARLIEAQNAVPASQCLHSGEHAGEIETVFRKNTALHYVIARDEGILIGAMGCEIEDGRAYLQGPFVRDGDFAHVAGDLWSALQAQNYPVERCDAFINVRNERAASFYLSNGFKRGQGAQIYVMQADLLPPLNGEPAERFTPAYADEVRALHRLAFPDSPLSIESFMQAGDEDRCLFLFSDGRRCLGYIAASINDSPLEGYIDLLAVNAAVRNQGYGRRLLLTAAHWLIQERGMPQVGLTVRDMRADARGLYQRSGFKLLYAGVGYSRDNGPTRKNQ